MIAKFDLATLPFTVRTSDGSFTYWSPDRSGDAWLRAARGRYYAEAYLLLLRSTGDVSGQSLIWIVTEMSEGPLGEVERAFLSEVARQATGAARVEPAAAMQPAS